MVDFENDIKNCIATLEQGGVILYPTDTIWGLGCNALNEAAIDKIYTIKQRPKEKSLIVLLAEPKDIFQYVAAPSPDIIHILENFRQPTTVIYNSPLGFPDNALHADGSIAIRITDDPFCKALIKRYKKPVVATSANISGHPSPQTFSQVHGDIISQAAYVVHYRQTDMTPRQPSRLVRILDDGSLDILRA